MNLRLALAAPLAALALLASAPGLRADYTLSADPLISQFSFGASRTSSVSFSGATSGSEAGAAQLTLENLSLATAALASNTDHGIVTFAFELTVVQTIGSGSTSAGTEVEDVSGTIQFTRSDVPGELSTLTSFNITPMTIGNTTYTFLNPVYSAPTPNGSGGSLGVTVTPTFSVPEPASLAMFGVGLGGLGLFRRLRRRAV